MGLASAPITAGPISLMTALAVSLFQLAPHALPDMFAIAVFAASVVALLVWHTNAIKVMLFGSMLGVLCSRLRADHRA
jgi:hypothetical protein